MTCLQCGQTFRAQKRITCCDRSILETEVGFATLLPALPRIGSMSSLATPRSVSRTRLGTIRRLKKERSALFDRYDDAGRPRDGNLQLNYYKVRDSIRAFFEVTDSHRAGRQQLRYYKVRDFLREFFEKPGVANLAREAFGRTSVYDQSIYITDGGHYDNLGLVEALRRKPATVYALDASNDHEDSFKALGRAITTARMDLDCEVEIDPRGMPPLAWGALAYSLVYRQGDLCRWDIGDRLLGKGGGRPPDVELETCKLRAQVTSRVPPRRVSNTASSTSRRIECWGIR